MASIIRLLTRFIRIGSTLPPRISPEFFQEIEPKPDADQIPVTLGRNGHQCGRDEQEVEPDRWSCRHLVVLRISRVRPPSAGLAKRTAAAVHRRRGREKVICFDRFPDPFHEPLRPVDPLPIARHLVQLDRGFLGLGAHRAAIATASTVRRHEPARGTSKSRPAESAA